MKSTSSHLSRFSILDAFYIATWKYLLRKVCVFVSGDMQEVLESLIVNHDTGMKNHFNQTVYTTVTLLNYTLQHDSICNVADR